MSFEASHIRPTTDRVKETLFNKLMHAVEGANILDLFCGTGSLGIEALSRGADHVTFVDDSAKSLSILRRNLEKLRITEGFKIVKWDAFQCLRNWEQRPCDVLLIDPPFTKVLGDKIIEAVIDSKVVKQGTLIAMETASKEFMKPDYEGLNRLDEKKFGDKTLHLFEVES